MGHFQYSLCTIAVYALLATACTKPEDKKQPVQAPAALVSVVALQPQSIRLIENLPARVSAYRIAEIRPQVGGIVEQVLFSQGSMVEAGQPLFKINSDILQADLRSNQAALERGQAEVTRLKALLARYAALLPSHAISQQEYNNTEAAYHQALADVSQLKANLSRQKLNLKYSTVTAPISGRIGQVLVTEGALVGQADPKAMAIVQQISQVYVDVKQSMNDYEKLQEAIQRGELSSSHQSVEILNSQAKPYQVKARILFSDTSVDPDTGDVSVRILADNPNQQLLPGMYVRVNMNRAVIESAILVPEQAIQRDISGKASVTVVDAQQQGVIKAVELGQRYQNDYVVTHGLNAGDKVVVEGADRIQPKQKLKIKIWQPPQIQAENKG